MRLGLAHVQLGEPGWSFADLVESDRNSRIDALRPARVTSVEEFGVLGSDADRAFIDGIDRQVQTSRTGEAVIYVPGYRVTFDQVMVLMGSWAHYLGRSSSVVAFSWPTGTSVWNYLVDCPRARAFVPDIARLVELVAERSQARRINLIAFSCGSPLLAEALVELRNRHPAEDHAALQRRYRIANAIFVAADIDLQTFARSHLPALNDIARRTEVYVSENDGALKFASLLSRASRLGRPSFDELTRDELETLSSNDRLVGIDVADVYGAHELAGMRGHGYWVANERDLQRRAAVDDLSLRPGLARPGARAGPQHVDLPRRLSRARRSRGVRGGARIAPRGALARPQQTPVRASGQPATCRFTPRTPTEAARRGRSLPPMLFRLRADLSADTDLQLSVPRNGTACRGRCAKGLVYPTRLAKT